MPLTRVQFLGLSSVLLLILALGLFLHWRLAAAELRRASADLVVARNQLEAARAAARGDPARLVGFAFLDSVRSRMLRASALITRGDDGAATELPEYAEPPAEDLAALRAEITGLLGEVEPVESRGERSGPVRLLLAAAGGDEDTLSTDDRRAVAAALGTLAQQIDPGTASASPDFEPTASYQRLSETLAGIARKVTDESQPHNILCRHVLLDLAAELGASRGVLADDVQRAVTDFEARRGALSDAISRELGAEIRWLGWGQGDGEGGVRHLGIVTVDDGIHFLAARDAASIIIHLGTLRKPESSGELDEEAWALLSNPASSVWLQRPRQRDNWYERPIVWASSSPSGQAQPETSYEFVFDRTSKFYRDDIHHAQLMQGRLSGGGALVRINRLHLTAGDYVIDQTIGFVLE